MTADRTISEPGERPPDWWHRDHPTFTALAGFFAGLAFVGLVPALFVGLLRLVLSDENADALFPFVLVFLAIPIGLVVTGRSRRFGTYMLLGMIVCAVVVVGVATLVLWVIARNEA
jgi:4-amino-4-deoxy-L-arabinose transferase-like glycosyltransferase